MPNHIVAFNECVNQLANEYSVSVQDIINHPDNRLLFEKRSQLNCLAPGDQLFIPASKTVSLQLNQINELVVEDNRYTLSIQLVDIKLQPVPGIEVRCTYRGLGDHLSTTTNSDGEASFSLPETAQEGMLAYQLNQKTIYRPFIAGSLLPIEHEQGIMQRLCNLKALPFNARNQKAGVGIPLQAQLNAYAEECNQSEKKVKQCLSGII